MKNPNYVKIVTWSEEDQVFVGRCPDLFFGGTHGDNEVAVYSMLCQLVDDEIASLLKRGLPLPEPRTKIIEPVAA